MRLTASEREALAEELLVSIDDNEREAIDRAWLEKVRRRDAELLSGKVAARPVAEVLERLWSSGKN